MTREAARQINPELFHEIPTADSLRKKYTADKAAFFYSSDLATVTDLPFADRISILGDLCNSLEVSSKHLEAYFATYPEDFETIKEIFLQNNRPETASWYFIFSTGATLFLQEENTDSQITRDFVSQFAMISERKELARHFLMGRESENSLATLQTEFGTHADGLVHTVHEASQLLRHGSHRLDTAQIFTPDFAEMPEEKQAQFLRQSISIVHNLMVREETFNSWHTKDNTTPAERIPRTSRSTVRRENAYNNAHSIIFQTYQPVSVFNYETEYFTEEMNTAPQWGGNIEEFPLQRILLALIEKMNDLPRAKENSDTLVQFWDKNRNPIFGNAVADALSTQDPNYAAKLLLEKLRAEKSNKNPLAAILYRLEFGKIGISEEGVRYLEKMYDLGEYNDPNYHAERLTNDGSIGIFNADLELIKHFSLTDLDSDEAVVKASVLDFTYETLFLKKTGETPAETEKRLQYLQEFKKHYHEIAQEKMFTETGIRLNNLSFKEQGWFVLYLQNANPEQKTQMVEFLKTFGEDGLRTFMAMEFNETLGAEILILPEKIGTEACQLIFSKYSELAYIALSIRENIGKQTSTDIGPDEETLLTNKLLERAHTLIADFVQKPDDTHPTPKDETPSLLEKLHRVKAGHVLLAETVRLLRGKLEAKDILGLKFEISTQKEISKNKKLQKKLLALAAERNPGEFGKKVVLPALQAAFEKPNNTFYILTKDNDPIGFLRLEQTGADQFNFGSFNVDENLDGSGFGGQIFSQSINTEAENGAVITANVDIDNPIATNYINKNGFVATTLMRNVSGTGVDGFRIIRDDSARRTITETREYSSRAEFLTDAERHFSEGEVIMRFEPKSKTEYKITYGMDEVNKN